MMKDPLKFLAESKVAALSFRQSPVWERISRTTSTTLPNRIRSGPKVPS